MTVLPEKPDKVKELSEKILLAQSKGVAGKEHLTSKKNVSYVWRMVLELVIGMVLGFGIGFVLDKWLATAPLMMIIMSLFGFAAGIRTMLMTANEFVNLNKKIRKEE